MRKIVLTGLMAAAALALGGCDEDRAEDAGPMAERDYQVGAFDKIELAESYDATVQTGSGPAVQAKGGENILDQLVVEVDGNTLKIHRKQRNGVDWPWGKHKNEAVALTISVPVLRGAELIGAGGIEIDRVRGDRFDGSVAGAGEMSIGQVEVENLKLAVAGAGEAKASGKAKTAEYEIAGSGDIDGKSIIAEDAKVSIAGSGGVTVHATRTADVSIAGSGDVDLTGGAKCTTSKVGSGNVHCN